MKIRYTEPVILTNDRYEQLGKGYYTRPIRSEPTAWARVTRTQELDNNPGYIQPNSSIGQMIFPKLPDLTSADAFSWPSDSTPAKRAYNKAYQSFIEKMGGMEEVGTALAETASSFRMAHNRAHQLWNAWDVLRRGTLKEMFTVLGMDRDLLKREHEKIWNRHTKSLENASGLWLEYWMGWSPLMSDIYAAPRAFASLQPKYFIRTGGSREYNATYRRGQPPNGRTSVDGSCSALIECHMSGTVRVTNPNYHLAKNLGMSPQDIIWNITPWSWMIDWFTNVGQVVSSMNDWVGVELTDYSCTMCYKDAKHVERFYNFNGVSGTRVLTESRVVRATPKGFPQPQPVIHLPDFSLTRLATTLSLIGTRIFR